MTEDKIIGMQDYLQAEGFKTTQDYVMFYGVHNGLSIHDIQYFRDIGFRLVTSSGSNIFFEGWVEEK